MASWARGPSRPMARYAAMLAWSLMEWVSAVTGNGRTACSLRRLHRAWKLAVWSARWNTVESVVRSRSMS